MNDYSMSNKKFRGIISDKLRPYFLFYDQEIIDMPDLHIPHIDLHNRDFVLVPMNQIAPYLRHPVLNQTISQLLDSLLNKSENTAK